MRLAAWGGLGRETIEAHLVLERLAPVLTLALEGGARGWVVWGGEGWPGRKSGCWADELMTTMAIVLVLAAALMGAGHGPLQASAVVPRGAPWSRPRPPHSPGPAPALVPAGHSWAAPAPAAGSKESNEVR